MKVLLLKDVIKLGRAGEVKKVANGYGRNYLLPQGLAVLATPGSLKQAEWIRQEADSRREEMNREMTGVADKLSGIILAFPARASETGKLYGSITTQMIAEELRDKTGVDITRRQVDSQPLRSLGEHKVPVRLTVDLMPEVTVIVHREGESPSLHLAETAEVETPQDVEEIEATEEESPAS